ncbi:hypothetical protein NUW54_g9258 [Trametes sanguinea]|uniref:Uncharacterized protein n=1 Tax=Trametes sanguinea TaxID=158606 RepID=A0ACC1P8K0_9APHY|nr:hypothetical protein NUW54_g9258 [Trametes sanguinea]
MVVKRTATSNTGLPTVLGRPPRCRRACWEPVAGSPEICNALRERTLAQVRALAIADLLGPLVKLRWFIRSRDLWLRQCSDTFTSDYFKLAGENELFPLRHETITSGDAIHEVIAVERFDPASISLRAFNDKTLYYREGYYFERVLIADFYRLPRAGNTTVSRTKRVFSL